MSEGYEWLDWLEPSGPFLATPVLKKAFPQGLDTLDPNKRRTLRQAYDEYRQALDDEDPESSKFHAAWIDLVLKQGLEYDEDESGDNLKADDDLPDGLLTIVAEHGVTLRPDLAVVDDQNADKPMMLIQVYGQEVDLNDAIRGDGWASSPRERMVRLCRDTGSRLGLITNGEHWLFVHAPVGAVSSFASWYARLWGPEPVLLQAFVALLGIRRFFVAEEEQLSALIDKSVEYQDEVTEALGEQVRRAVEVLIQALDKADVDRNRELLKDVDPRELYEAGLTVMMRLVFLLSAEERELLLLGDERYEANYAVSTLRMQLRGEDDAILQRRWDAWSRLLATFRAIYGGIEHGTLRMPALGGSLFDPDRFAFLEGRNKGSNWKTNPAKPLPIDNQTVLLLLEAIQLFEGRTLSYRGLDIEQLGYVYEGLLDHTVKRAKEVTLELDATKSAKQPWVTVGELESAKLDGDQVVENLLKERTGSSISRVRNDLDKKVKPQQSIDLLTACHNDQVLHDQLKRYFHLIRADSWGRPLVYPQKSFMVTTGEDRRQTGSHYTPVSLTEKIVMETLEPVVYIGPAMGTPRDEWRPKLPAELLELKICDPAMGSGAFLVQVCRWLGERLVESWEIVEANGGAIDVDGAVHKDHGEFEPLPLGSEERVITARRLIAERCIYGVDINPLAVELAKVSIWLVTLSKGRPFGFLDHNLRSGDSLLGVHNIEQLIQLHPDPTKGDQLHTGLFDHRNTVRRAVERALEIRLKVRTHRVREIGDVQEMARLNASAQDGLTECQAIADAIMGETLAHPSAPDDGLLSIAVTTGACLKGDGGALQDLRRRAKQKLATDLPSNGATPHPFHWALEFPEVFLRDSGGFDAIVGNPPFLGGQRITGAMGTAYRTYLVEHLAQGARGSADLVAYFYLRAYRLIRENGDFGLLAVNTIAEGDTRQVGLERLVGEHGAVIYAAYPNEAWPGKAAVVTSRVHIRKGTWSGTVTLGGKEVEQVSAFLSDQDEWTQKRLLANANKAFQGSIILGMGFTLSEEEAVAMIERDPKNRRVLYPYLNGKDLNTHPEQKPSRWIVNFFDWTEQKAKEYFEPYRIVLEKVKPERDQLNQRTADGRRRKKYWWKYGRDASGLYHAIGRGASFELHPEGWNPNRNYLSRVLVRALNSKHNTFEFVPSEQVIDQTLNVFTTDKNYVLAILDSSIHEAWFYRNASTLGASAYPRYIQTNIYLTFPFPVLDGACRLVLEEAGQKLELLRTQSFDLFQTGLTGVFNKLCNPAEDHQFLQELRKLKVYVDQVIIEAYGWDDIELDHGFHEISDLPKSDRIRYTISEQARLVITNRLARLNKERYEEEVLSGLHAKKKTKKKAVKKKKIVVKVYESSSSRNRELSKVAESPPPQMDIFSGSVEPANKSSGNQWGSNPVDQILAWLEAHAGWHAKQVILNGCQVDPKNWDNSIEVLLKEGFVETLGDASRYRAVF